MPEHLDGHGKCYPSFDASEFLQDHIEQTLEFYRRHAFDPRGGFFHCFNDDGSVYDQDLRHLVSSCRFVVNFAMSAVKSGNENDRQLAEHGLKYLENVHRQANGSYAWEMRDSDVSDPAIMGYGHAFVLLAASCAIKAEISDGKAILEDAWALLESRFWEPDHSAYCDEFSEGFEKKSAYRGQNANMHMCEACIAAWQATGEQRFLNRAQILAKTFTVNHANQTKGLVWEHYHQDWTPDFVFNKDRPDDLFRPWGFQPGHQVEWARLLLMLDDIAPEVWRLDRAKFLYDQGMQHGRDTQFGGIFYGFGPTGSASSTTKYYWVHSEALATAWRLFRQTGTSSYRRDYETLWRYAWDHFVDHEYGAWYRVLNRDGSKVDCRKSPPGKTDYHTVGVMWDILENL